MSEGRRGLEVWTVYDHPSDLPEEYVARLSWVTKEGEVKTDRVIRSTRLDDVRFCLEAYGKICLTRDPLDDPVIIEVWI